MFKVILKILIGYLLLLQRLVEKKFFEIMYVGEFSRYLCKALVNCNKEKDIAKML